MSEAMPGPISPELENIKEEILTDPSEETVGPTPVPVQIVSGWPSIRAITRVVVVVSLLLFVFNRIESVIGSVTTLLFLVVLSIFLAYLIDPLVKLIRKPFKLRSIERFMPRSIAIVIAFVFVFSVLTLTIVAIAPIVSQQARDFAANIPSYGISIQRTLNDVNRRFDRLKIPDEVQTKINEQAVILGERITTGIGGFVLSFLTFVPWLIIIPILAFFFLKDVNSFRLGVLRLFPPGRWRLRADSVLGDANDTLAAYVRAMLISCFLIGFVCTIGFYIIGLKFALLLGILAGVLEFVPLLGPAATGIIVVLTTLAGDNPWNAIPAAIFLIALRIVHDYVTYPRIIRGGIHLHPVAIILSVLAGEQIAGIPGVFLAIPVVALGTVAYKHFLEHQGSRTLFEGLVHQSESADVETP